MKAAFKGQRVVLPSGVNLDKLSVTRIINLYQCHAQSTKNQGLQPITLRKKIISWVYGGKSRGVGVRIERVSCQKERK